MGVQQWVDELVRRSRVRREERMPIARGDERLGPDNAVRAQPCPAHRLVPPWRE